MIPFYGNFHAAMVLPLAQSQQKFPGLQLENWVTGICPKTPCVPTIFVQIRDFTLPGGSIARYVSAVSLSRLDLQPDLEFRAR